MVSKYYKYLCCPDCQGGLEVRQNYLRCRSCKRKYLIREKIARMMPKKTSYPQISSEKWDQIYAREYLRSKASEKYDFYFEHYYKDTFSQINSEKKIRDLIYLEIGCGGFFFGAMIAGKSNVVIGIDTSLRALRIAKGVLESHGIENYLLINGDIMQMPIKDESVDLVYGGGTIEHFDDTTTALKEIRRVLKKRGVSFNTVPVLNLASLTYRQKWGNIPDFPILKQVARFIHIKILRGRHMKFGYELSFPIFRIKALHRQAGFKNIKVGLFKSETFLQGGLPETVINFLRKLSDNHKILWSMIKVVAVK